MAVIRMIGAFGGAKSRSPILSAIRAECAELVGRERAASHIGSCVKHAKIGVLFKSRDVARRFKGDVWSVAQTSGRLVPTRRAIKSAHSELFLRAGARPVGVVIFDGCQQSAVAQACYAARENGLFVARACRDGNLTITEKMDGERVARLAKQFNPPHDNPPHEVKK